MEDDIINRPRMNGTTVIADQKLEDYGFVSCTKVDVNHMVERAIKMDLNMIEDWNNGRITV